MKYLVLYDLILNSVHEMTKEDQNSFIIQKVKAFGVILRTGYTVV